MQEPAIDPAMAKLIAVNTAVQLFASTLGGMFGNREVANAMMAQALMLTGAETDAMKAHQRVPGIWQHMLATYQAEANAAGGVGENVVPLRQDNAPGSAA